MHVGSAGTLLCNPMFMDFAEGSGMAFDPEPTQYGIRFAMADDENRSITSTEGALGEGRYAWMDSRQLAVNDTTADKVITVTLVKLTSIGESDVPVARAQVPTEKLAAIYAAVDVK